VQQVSEAFPFEPSAKFLILDHDAKYGTEVPTALRSMEITSLRTAIGCLGRTVWLSGGLAAADGSY